MRRKSKVEGSKAPTPTVQTEPAPAEDSAPSDSSAKHNNGDGDVSMEDQDHHQIDGHLPSDAAAAETDASSDTVDKDSDAGLELLGQGIKAFVTLIQNLRDLGVEELVLPLPRICVLGDQSTGKSSLIEGISGIKVPRSSGTCTRCPLEINLSASEVGSPWQAKMYLQKRYIYEGIQTLPPFGRSAAQGATKNRPLGPWIAQALPESTLFFKTFKKTDIPGALRLAQLATLNPGTDPARFKPTSPTNQDDRIQVKFSPNIVKLEISGPEVPNLSFFDLPGVINQAEVPAEEDLVKLVANLCKTYAKTDTCINLLALPMTDDAANSTASKLVHELGAEDRTLGVLTKPDRVQSEEGMNQWIDILCGRKFRLGHGYYVVKNNPDPKVSNTTARQEEEDFFKEEPWIRTLGSYYDRFGTLKLSAKLSKLLNSQIRKSLPKITEQVRLKTAEVIARLEKLPEPPKGNLCLKIFEKISTFEHDLARHFDGGSEAYPFPKDFHAAALRFRNTIAFSYPRLSLTDSSVAFKSSAQLPYRQSATPTPSGSRPSDIIPIDSDEECEVTPKLTHTPSPSKRKLLSNGVHQTSSTKRSRLERIPQFVPGQDNGLNSLDSSSTGPSGVDRKAPFAKRYALAEIRTILLDAQTSLPNQIDPKATKRMIRDSLSCWDGPLNEFLEYTGQACLAMILERASCVFALWQGTRCYDLLLEISQSFFQEKFRIQTLAAKRTLDMEQQTALTLHEGAMRNASEGALMALENACRTERVKAFLAKQDPEWDNNLGDRAKSDKVSKVTDIQLGPNPFVQELRALADVRGYYECAFSRFVDVIYQGIQTELFTACRNELRQALKQGIGLEERDAEEKCAILLAVDPENERIRGELLKQKSNLEKACKWFESE